MKTNNTTGTEPALRQITINLTASQLGAISPLVDEFRTTVEDLIAAGSLAFLEMHAGNSGPGKCRDVDCLVIHSALTDFVARRRLPEIVNGDLNTHGWGVEEAGPESGRETLGGGS